MIHVIGQGRFMPSQVRMAGKHLCWLRGTELLALTKIAREVVTEVTRCKDCCIKAILDLTHFLKIDPVLMD